MLTTLLASLLALMMILVAAGLLRRLRAAQVGAPPSPRVLPTQRIPNRQLRHEALMSRGRALGLML
jgi:hypothetical protein